MKRVITMTVMLLMVAMGMQAQSLLGKWKTAPEIDKDGDKTTFFFIFDQGNKAQMKLVMESSDAEVGDFTFSLTIPGTYKRNGNEISFNFDTKKGTGKLEKMVYKGEMAELIKNSPELKKGIDEMLHKQIDTELKKSFKDEQPFGGALVIKKLTATELWFDEDGDTTKLTRTK